MSEQAQTAVTAQDGPAQGGSEVRRGTDMAELASVWEMTEIVIRGRVRPPRWARYLTPSSSADVA